MTGAVLGDPSSTRTPGRPTVAAGRDVSARRHAPPGDRAGARAGTDAPSPARRPASAPLRPGQGPRTRPGSARRCSPCWSAPPSSTCGASAHRLGQQLLLGRRPGRAPRAGRRSSSAPPTPRTSSPSTSRRPLLWADGDLGPDLRRQLVEHPGAPGPGGRGHGRPGLPLRAALVQRPGPPCWPAPSWPSRRWPP